MEATTASVAEYARDLEFEDLSEGAVERTKRVVLDTIGCSLGAYTSPPSKALRSCFGDKGDEATVVGSGRRRARRGRN